jgi:inhibitor of cysteine peptidase
MRKTYSKKDERIVAKVGDVFSLELESNPTTGYQWLPSIDSDKVELLDRSFKSAGNQIGSSGKEVFTFKTLAAGDSTIRLNYKRSWENESLESVQIKLESQN